MGFLIKAGGGDFEQHPAGVFPGRCTRIVDLGTQDETFEGKSKKVRKVVLFFESDQLLTEGDLAGQPFMLTKEFSVSMGEKASLRIFLEAWRGRAFTREEAVVFDIDTVLGKPCLLNVVEYKKRDGSDSVKIGSAMPLPNGMKANKAIGDVFSFCLYEEETGTTVKVLDTANLSKLSNYWQERIKKSPEYKKAASGGDKAAEQGTFGSGFEDMDDDIPL